MEIRQGDRTFGAVLFGVGLVVGSLFGMLLWMLRKGSVQPAQPINIWNSFGPGANMPALPAATAPLPDPGSASKATSDDARLTSVVLGTDYPFKLFTAPTGQRWKVQARTIGPPGAVAYLSTNGAGFINANAPDFETVGVPSGQWIDVVLMGGQSLRGIGSISGTTVSISASREG